MSNPKKKEGKRPSSFVLSSLRKEFLQGEKSARDPDNAGLPPLALHVTSLYSKWFTQTCPVCDNLFREGDRVRFCPKCMQAFHDDQEKHLSCWTTQFEGEHKSCDCEEAYTWDGYLPDEERVSSENIQLNLFSSDIYKQVLGGLSTSWKIPGNLEVTFAQKNDNAVGHVCPYCGFKIREGDRYIKCGDCQKVYFHNDIFRHLTCWNEWKSQKGKDYCPISNEKCKYSHE